MKRCHICGEDELHSEIIKCDYCGKNVCVSERCLETEDVKRNEDICHECFWR